MIRKDKILFIPSARKGNGTGHLKRCVHLASGFPVQNFYIPSHSGIIPDNQIDELTKGCTARTIYRDNPGKDWDLCILDNRLTGAADLPSDLEDLPLIAIDEGGSLRETVPYLIDILPGIYNQKANREGLSFLNLPGWDEHPSKSRITAEESEERFHKVLITFGGEDPADLSSHFSDRVFRKDNNLDWQLVQGPAFHKTFSSDKKNLSVIKGAESLNPYIKSSDLVICSYGITAFEAVSAGIPVLLLNPTEYHDRLAESVGFPCIRKAWRKGRKTLFREYRKQIRSKTFLENNKKIQDLHRIRPEEFSRWLEDFTPGVNRCPVCGRRDNPAIFRSSEKTYFRCGDSRCRIVYMINFHEVEAGEIYNDDYFFEDYRKQYGKTYIQDFPHIKKMGLKRLKQIRKMTSSHKTLLDIGCAYGPFLSASSDCSYESYGIDVIKGGINYIKDNLPGIRVCVSSFEDFNPEKEFRKSSFDIITLWYVIEHFKNLQEVLDKIDCLLDENGILAFATPNGRGVSAQMNRGIFYANSPDDHYTIWDPLSVRKILKMYGFGKIKIIQTGFHPERIPWKLPFRTFLNKTILLWACQIFQWGDTFEIYAIKKGKK